jgi:transposase
MGLSPRGSTMPGPISLPVRQAMFRLWQQGRNTSQIAASFGLPGSTVRRLVGRFRQFGPAGISPDYPRAATDETGFPEMIQAALRLRRGHPTWGAGLIRVHLLQAKTGLPVPSERAIQRWLARAGLAPAPRGRRPKADATRATLPHETWQMDAKEKIPIQSREKVSWLRLTDECSGAMLWTTVFPPRLLGTRPPRGRSGAAPPGLCPLGAARPHPRRQRRAVGLDGRLPDRVVALADRTRDRDALELPEESPGGRRDRTLPGDVESLVRAADLRDGRGTASAVGPDGPPAPRIVSLPGAPQPHGLLPGPEAFRAALCPRVGGGALEMVARG